MAPVTYASAEPKKRLFISLLTRDISLADAVLDLIDNSINSAIILSDTDLNEPADYISLLDRKPAKNLPTILISFDGSSFRIQDTCGGISFAHAQTSVFRFGRDDPDEADDSDPSATEQATAKPPGVYDDTEDRLSVYGIGLKRALFKIGNKISMKSAHPEGGFDMTLNVRAWKRLPQPVWQIPITRTTSKIDGAYGTNVVITDLFEGISKRLTDGSFEGELIRRTERTYSFFLNRIVVVKINGEIINPVDLNFSNEKAQEGFALGNVACVVMAGIAESEGKTYLNEIAGWYVYCNGRAVAFADKTYLTGWGSFLPTYQPKHRPFIGLVFFTSSDPEKLPWTTTKSSINQESEVWQQAVRTMGTVGRQITSYLDSRYTNEGTEITVEELRAATGGSQSAFRAISLAPRTFTYVKPVRTHTTIQYRARIEDVASIKAYLGRRGMSNREVGEHTFEYFIENAVE